MKPFLRTLLSLVISNTAVATISQAVCRAESPNFEASVRSANRPPPPLSYPGDDERPYPFFSITSNLASPVFDVYGVHAQLALGRHQSISLEPSMIGDGDFELAGGYRVWPFGNGLDGIYGELSGGIGNSSVQGSRWEVGVGAGYQIAWGSVALDIEAKIAIEKFQGGDISLRNPIEELRLGLGYVWM